METIGSLIQFIYTLLLISGIGIVISFGFFYLFIWGGLKILKITGVPRKKIVVYLFALFLLSIFISPRIYGFVEENRMLSSIVFYISLLFPSILIFKYYWRLQNIELLKFLGWFIVIGMVLSLITSLLLGPIIN